MVISGRIVRFFGRDWKVCPKTGSFGLVGIGGESATFHGDGRFYYFFVIRITQDTA
jgi:hypothetical protein